MYFYIMMNIMFFLVTLVLALVWVKLISRWLIAASIAPNCALPATPRKKKKKRNRLRREVVMPKSP